MKTILLTLVCIVTALACFTATPRAAEEHSGATFEYATIRWGGRDNTHIIRPGTKVEFIGTELRKVQKPDRADERSFYMNLAMNGLSKEGWKLAAMTNDDIVMKRVRKN
jgi:hypothetical protein